MGSRCLEIREEFSYNKKPQFLEVIINSIELAKYGDKKHYKSHPDFINRLDKIVLGDFPNNVDKVYWLHLGFEGCFSPKPSPISPSTEIFAILKLKTYCYLSIYYKEADLSINMTASSHYDRIILNLPSSIYSMYLHETQLVQRTPVFSPSSLPPIKSSKPAYTPLSNTPVAEEKSDTLKSITLDDKNTTFWDAMKDMTLPQKKTTFQEPDPDEKIDFHNAEYCDIDNIENTENADDNTSTET